MAARLTLETRDVSTKFRGIYLPIDCYVTSNFPTEQLDEAAVSAMDRDNDQTLLKIKYRPLLDID